MRTGPRAPALVLILLAFLAASCSKQKTAGQAARAQQVNVRIDWDKVVALSRTTPTLQVVVNPPLRRGSKIHDPVFQALHNLGADFVRYVPWLPYPKLGVAELDPPQDSPKRKTSWDFSLIDPMTEDFINATPGHSVILNFSTIPQWMFKTEKPVTYPSDPDQVTWDYEEGTEFRDPSLKEVADYYARLVSWYTKGGFADEYGKRHNSGHHYKIDYWEVLNEVDSEHQMTPQTYTRVYDAIVGAVRAVNPEIKFVGLALASEPQGYFEYFLNHKNHKPGIPIDMISYHFYAVPTADQTPDITQYTYWEQADRFLAVVDYIQAIRARLSPETKTDTDELGSISADDLEQNKPGHVTKPIPNSYWNLCGGLYAYLYAELARRGVEVAGESQLVGYPTQFPSVSMVDWNTGQPNARYWVLKLLHDSFGPGDKLVETHLGAPYVYAQAFVTRQGQRKLLLVNKRDRAVALAVPDSQGSDVAYVDQSTSFQPPGSAHLGESRLSLSGFEVAVVNLSR